MYAPAGGAAACRFLGYNCMGEAISVIFFEFLTCARSRGARTEERGAGGSASLCVHCDLSIRGHLGEKFFYKGSS